MEKIKFIKKNQMCIQNFISFSIWDHKPQTCWQPFYIYLASSYFHPTNDKDFLHDQTLGRILWAIWWLGRELGLCVWPT